MQPMYEPYAESRSNRHSYVVGIVAILLFALSGLITGYATGAFAHFHNQQAQNATPRAQQQQTPTISASQPQRLALPKITDYIPAELADSTTTYTFSAQAIDQAHQEPVHQSGITCKLWLVHAEGKPQVPRDRLISVNTLQNSFADFGEINKMTFDPTTPQTQPCNAMGQGTWKYQISPTANRQSYYLVILTDWAGQWWNWSWATIGVTHGNQ